MYIHLALSKQMNSDLFKNKTNKKLLMSKSYV